MGTRDKALERIKRLPNDYTFDEAESLLRSLGFTVSNKGKTSGSRVRFFRSKDKRVIDLHKPHPSKECKPYVVKQLKEFLTEIGELS